MTAALWNPLRRSVRVALRICLSVTLAGCFAVGASAGQASGILRPAALFSDGMVLQRNAPIRVWGWATPGESVRVTLRGRSTATMTAADGRWRVTLPAMAPGGPYTLVIAGASRLTLRDVLIGDVWLCAGQSNMERDVAASGDARREVAAARFPRIRHIKVSHRARFTPQDDVVTTGWRRATPDAVGAFSAAGYYFARDVHAATSVPIGLINVAWGGTFIETWMSPALARRDHALLPWVQTMPVSNAEHATARQQRAQAQIDRWQKPLDFDPDAAMPPWFSATHDDRGWSELAVPAPWERQGLRGFDGYVWYRRTVTLTDEQAAGPASLSLGMIDDCDDTWVNGWRVGGRCGWDTPRSYDVPAGMLHGGDNVLAVRVTDTGGDGGFHGEANRVYLQTATARTPLAGRWRARVEAPLAPDPTRAPHANDLPTLAYNGMIHPLRDLAVRGVLWYQGESNVSRSAAYATAFRALIADWRVTWQRPDMPFYFVQLAAFLPLQRNNLQHSDWANLRDAQAQALRLPHTGMASAIDIGDADDIHPANKQDVGRRLAGIALTDNYRLVPRAPQPRFHHALVRSVASASHRRAAELALSFVPAPASLATRDGKAPRGFAVAGVDQVFHAAQARIERRRGGDHIVVWSDAVAAPVAVRYAWVDNPSEANLIEPSGLPIPPFRSDAWPLLDRADGFMP
ncbi:MAG: hypothetical protein JNL19_12665 [Burkholderiales bacterium]|nr:hypothetical protein [Burkholderiales bacterium]